MNQRFEQTAFYPADILLPQTAEMKKWPVVACDQFTSQPDYWQAAEAAVGEAPSALRLVLPEVYLNGPDVDKRIETINASMDRRTAPRRPSSVRRRSQGSAQFCQRSYSTSCVTSELSVVFS